MFVIMLSACAPSPSALQTAIAETQAAWTKTPSPTSTPIPTATPEALWVHCILGNTMTQQYYDSLLLQRICVYGVITDKVETETGTLYNIFPSDKPITFLIVVRVQEELEKVFPGATGILTNADVGDCIVIIGYPARLEGGGPQFLGVDVRDIPQLTAELGASNSTVQEITGLCR